MQLSYLFTALLAGLSLATPITDPVGGDLSARAENTDNYKKVAAVHSDLQKDHWYVFTQKWPLGDAIKGDHESKTELQKLQNSLGFEHIAVVVGQVTEDKDGARDFKATIYDLVKTKDGDKSPIDIEKDEWRAPKSKKIEYVAGTTEDKSKKVGTFNGNYKKAKDHKIYDVEKNNCDTYAKYLISKL